MLRKVMVALLLLSAVIASGCGPAANDASLFIQPPSSASPPQICTQRAACYHDCSIAWDLNTKKGMSTNDANSIMDQCRRPCPKASTAPTSLAACGFSEPKKSPKQK